MRIIAGKFRSRVLIAPKGNCTRPTLDRTRESLFNIICSLCEDANVLDLFSGSGALALESLSRGARKATVCEISKTALGALKTNVANLQLEERVHLLKCDWKKAADFLYTNKKKFDIIFLDPPYSFDYSELVCYFYDHDLLNEDGIIVIEHDKSTIIPKSLDYEIYDERSYRDTKITFVRKVKNGYCNLSRKF